eukprot:4013540-Pyramimonas_sp.AAC.1
MAIHEEQRRWIRFSKHTTYGFDGNLLFDLARVLVQRSEQLCGNVGGGWNVAAAVLTIPLSHGGHGSANSASGPTSSTTTFDNRTFG